jgi:CBS domain-containing protein
MKVATLMQCEVQTCRADDTLQFAAKLMWDRDCGCIPVVDADLKILGVITDRDICMGAYTQGKSLHEIPVRVSMSKQAWCCRADDPISVAERILQERKVRRLPVIDEAGRLVGILSLNDIARHASTTRAEKRKAVSDAEVGETLAAICEPRLSCPVETRKPAPLEAAA